MSTEAKSRQSEKLIPVASPFDNGVGRTVQREFVDDPWLRRKWSGSRQRWPRHGPRKLAANTFLMKMLSSHGLFWSDKYK